MNEHTLGQTRPSERLEPARKGRWARFKGSKVGRFLGVLLLPFVLIASRIELLIALLGKFKYATALFSMFVSIGAYTLYWGLPFAAGFVLLLFVHEMGHVIQLRREGIPASPPFFIPFLGAAIGMREMPRNALSEARVGLAGPILGTAGAVVALGLAVLTDSDLLRALAFTAFFLNLFNLLPVSPLDGGRAVAAISPWLWLLGVAVLGAFLFFHFNALLLIVVLIGGVQSVNRLLDMRRRRKRAARRVDALEGVDQQQKTRQREWGLGPISLSFEVAREGKRDAPVDDAKKELYYQVAPGARRLVALTYVGLAALLGLGMSLSYVSHLPS